MVFVSMGYGRVTMAARTELAAAHLQMRQHAFVLLPKDPQLIRAQSFYCLPLLLFFLAQRACCCCCCYRRIALREPWHSPSHRRVMQQTLAPLNLPLLPYFLALALLLALLLGGSLEPVF